MLRREPASPSCRQCPEQVRLEPVLETPTAADEVDPADAEEELVCEVHSRAEFYDEVTEFLLAGGSRPDRQADILVAGEARGIRQKAGMGRRVTGISEARCRSQDVTRRCCKSRSRGQLA